MIDTILYCIMAIVLTGYLAKLFRGHRQLIWNKVALVLYSVCGVFLLLYAVLFWDKFFTAIAPYIR